MAVTGTSFRPSARRDRMSYQPNVLTTAGDLLDAAAGGVQQRLAAGSANTVLQTVSGAPAWGPVPSGGPQPDLNGFLAWTVDPATCNSTTAVNVGQARLTKMKVPPNVTI